MRCALLVPSIVLAGCAGGGAPVSRPADASRAQAREAPAREARAREAPAPPAAPARVLLEGGLTVPVPSGWHLATRVTRLRRPIERFTLSSSAPVRGGQDSCGPTTAARNLGTAQALAFVFEYDRPSDKKGFPPRPRQLRLPVGGPRSYECFGEGWLLRFREHGRAFQLMVALGRDARGGPVQRRLLRALDGVVVGSRGRA